MKSRHNMISLGAVFPVPDSKVHRAHMGSTWVLSAPDGPHVGPMNLAIKGVSGNSALKNATARLSYQLKTVRYNYLFLP